MTIVELEAETEDFDPDSEGDLDYSGDARSVTLDKNDRSLAEFYRWHEKGKLIIDPEWQRQYVWDTKRASRLIESFFLDIPIPVIYLAKTETGLYEVIDGLQRLTSWFRFRRGEFKLKGLEILKDMNGLTFADLGDKQQGDLEDATLRTFELSPKTDKDLMFVIFERLNTGGVALNEMEIRNCLYRGKLNKLIGELALYEPFVEALNTKNYEKRMKDRALVLRFFAFYERHYSKCRHGLKKFLNEFLETYRNPDDTKLDEYRKTFKRTMTAAYTIFGKHAFRLRPSDPKGGGEWNASVSAAVFQAITVPLAKYDKGTLTRASDAILEEYLDLLASDEKWLDSVRSSTGNTEKIEYAFKTWERRLEALLSGFEANDPKRLFSRQLKRERFEANRTCDICKQEIRTLNDCALDHERHYWRGGKTIPSNARLVHRTCNLERPD